MWSWWLERETAGPLGSYAVEILVSGGIDVNGAGAVDATLWHIGITVVKAL